MKKNLICISCPLGCNLDVVYEANKIVSVDGSTCKRGQAYAEKEIFNPERVVTTTVKVNHANVDLLPVKTDRAIRKEYMTSVMKEVFKINVSAPVKTGQIICENIADSGANLVATRTIEAK